MRFLLAAFCLISHLPNISLAATTQGLARGQVACPRSAVEILKNTRQLIVVSTKTWDTATAQMSWWQRRSASDKWQPASDSLAAVVGRSGLAWGYDSVKLPSPWRKAHEPVKIEGDGRTPAGIHRLGRPFGFSAPLERGDFLVLTPDTVCVDDPLSRFYNLVINSSKVKRDWQSAEIMREIELYKIGFIVDYHSSASKRAGSCIFIHIWGAPDQGTAGCLAASEEIVGRLQAWVKDPSRVAIAFLPEESLTNAWAGCFQFAN